MRLTAISGYFRFFISYAAHAYYELIPVWMSFALMAGITILTVYLAINYNKQVIF